MQKADLAGVYDETTAADRRAIVNASAQQVADVVAGVADDLAAIEPPPDLAEAHLVDVTHQRDLAALFTKGAALLRERKISEAPPWTTRSRRSTSSATSSR